MTDNWKKQPFFVIQDESYDNMVKEFKSGKKILYTFAHGCKDKSKTANKPCNCPKMENIFVNGNIARIIDGQQKPVYKMSDIINKI